MAQGTCVKCGAEDRYLPGRSLCAGCYDHHWRRGTLDEFPCRPPKTPEARTHRVCPICKQDLPLNAFARSKDRWDGHATYCKPCAREKYQTPARDRNRLVEPTWDGEKECRLCGETKPLTEFYWRRDHARHTYRCKACKAEGGRRYWAEQGSSHQRRRQLAAKFDLTPDQYEAMKAAQGDRCAVCRRSSEELDQTLAVDHCHTTGKVRGLLCANCNRGLGLFRDSPQDLIAAADYLRASVLME